MSVDVPHRRPDHEALATRFQHPVNGWVPGRPRRRRREMSGFKDTPALTVNETVVSLDRLLWNWKVSGKLQEMLYETAKEVYVADLAAGEGITATPEEVEEGLQAEYASLEVESEEQFVEALEAAGLTLEDVRAKVSAEIVREKVKEQQTAEQVPAYFEEHLDEYTTATLWEIAVTEQSLADELATQLREENADFEALARQHSVIEESAANGGYVGEQAKAALPEEVAAAIFSASPGTLVGPLKVEDKYFLVFVESINEPVLDEETYWTLRDQMFDEWVSAQLEETNVSLDLLGA
jgi:parvulin-like peptidyl-prolyl isomerase